MEQVLRKITPEVCNAVKAELEARYPHAQFKAFWHDLMEAYVIAVNDPAVYSSDEFTMSLGELESAYAPQYDIFDIYFVFEEF